MAEETDRKRSVRRIHAPGDTGTYVDLKVTDEITFTEQRPPYQEWVLSFKNNPDEASRRVHTVEVGDDKLKVEFLDELDTTEETGRRQEALWSFLNTQNPPAHLETHKTKIYASDGNGNVTDTGTWIEVQRIDSIEFEDPADEVRNQESVWVLANPDKQDADDDYKNLTAPITKWNGQDIGEPWRLDPFQTITDCSFGKVMLVLYGDRQLAYIPMASIKTPAGKVTKKTLAQSNWSVPSWFYFPEYFHITAFQAKLSSTWTALTANLQITADGVATIPDAPDQTPMFNSADTILRSAESSTPWTDRFGLPPYYSGPVSHVINGDASAVYNERGDKFTWDKTNGVSKVSSYSGNYLLASAFEQTAMAVSKTGGRYSDAIVDTILRVRFGWANPVTEAQHSAIQSSFGVYDLYAASGGPGNSDVTGQGANVSPSGSVSSLSWLNIYAKSGTLDTFTPTSSSVTVDADYTGINGSVPVSTMSGYWGYSQTDTDGSLAGELLAFPFPPPLGADKVYINVKQPGSGATSIITPYATHDLGNNPSTMFEPWLHLSNGKNVLQAYTVGDYTGSTETKIWLDGVDYGEALASAVGCTLNDIRAIFFDIKLSDIAQLK